MLFPAVVLVIIFWLLFCLRGRRNAPGLNALKEYFYAHRGLHNGECPENSMSAFARAFERGYGIEFDLHLLADGNLGVMHDSELFRITGKEGTMEGLTTRDLPNYFLRGTQETIPTFSQVLTLCSGRVPLIIELKSVNDNYEALTETAVQQLKDYKGLYCIESFDPRVVSYLRRNYPQIIRGQLAENYFRHDPKLSFLQKLICGNYLSNLKTCPDFIAEHFPDRKRLPVKLCRRLWKIQGVSWTVRSPEDFRIALQEGWIPIFEGFIPDSE